MDAYNAEKVIPHVWLVGSILCPTPWMAVAMFGFALFMMVFSFRRVP